jgi:hypothetical protein
MSKECETEESSRGIEQADCYIEEDRLRSLKERCGLRERERDRQ